MTKTAGIQAGDSVQRFYFSEFALRGAIVRLDNSFVEALNGRDYPAPMQALVGEALAAAVLMGSNFKHAARLSLQARGNGPLGMLMAESSCEKSTAGDAHSAQKVRALARFDTQHEQAKNLQQHGASLAALLADAQLAITVESIKDSGTERYQGIVAVDAATLSGCLEHYFDRSEQLPTTMVLAAGPQCAAGLMVQKIPDSDSADGVHAVRSNDWREIEMLARSISPQELLGLAPEQVLHRLFHQHSCRVAQAQPVVFSCTCSAERTGQALMQIDPREISSILSEDGEIVMDCEFCSARYRFDHASIERLNASHNATRH
ncbi:MAG: Hsp33 family molecular chaperone HslO [Gammaproteobacteria bacterium]|nr:Hsp33 family molecular chaperone HslO [Gammaproteobacteria bacterium]MBT8150632.1 Hsp33 family molecular chaperone HslO [Gammaproteobacteria bacterium]NND38216.1 Hsp33 family molecular chaperone HslO [Pseudomonadales bacterium]NNM12052.1 Hsp33 family molecular chaperone HslO [Pseudomonadales bacterium]RZV50298.1 MAG: Hsp33 family molecular chaperone HslO [Pseudomonadales bacterium]